MHCLGSSPLHDMLLNLHEFAFEGQNMKFTVNVSGKTNFRQIIKRMAH